LGLVADLYLPLPGDEVLLFCGNYVKNEHYRFSARLAEPAVACLKNKNIGIAKLGNQPSARTRHFRGLQDASRGYANEPRERSSTHKTKTTRQVINC
jgi:hypothetical protein